MNGFGCGEMKAERVQPESQTPILRSAFFPRPAQAPAEGILLWGFRNQFAQCPFVLSFETDLLQNLAEFQVSGVHAPHDSPQKAHHPICKED